MGWRHKLRPASFRWVPFKVESHEYEGGRRAVTHEYPAKDIPWTEDTGRTPEGFEITGYLWGENYHRERDALIAACNKKGPGTLVHPYRGMKRVNCIGLRVREINLDGGYCLVHMTFVEAGKPAFPKAQESQFLKLAGQLDQLVSDANDAFEEAFDIIAAPQYLLDSASGAVNSAAVAIPNALSGVAGMVIGVTNLVADVDTFCGEILAILTNPLSLAQKLSGLIGSLNKATSDPFEKSNATKKLINYGAHLTLPAPKTFNRARERNNLLAIVRHMRTVAVANNARALAEIAAAATAPVGDQPAAIVSAEDLKELRNELAASIEVQQADAKTDAVYTALANLKAELVRQIPSQSADLPRLRTVTPTVTVPSLVLAYDLYGSLDRERDLIARNGITHPGFVSGGTPLEVIDV